MNINVVSSLYLLCTPLWWWLVLSHRATHNHRSLRHRFSEIAMQRFFKPWLAPDFIFERSSYAATYNKSLNCLQNFAMKVSKQTDVFLCWLLCLKFELQLYRKIKFSCKETTAHDEKSLLAFERTMTSFSLCLIEVQSLNNCCELQLWIWNTSHHSWSACLRNDWEGMKVQSRIFFWYAKRTHASSVLHQ